MRRAEKKDFKQKKTEWSKATTTPLVSEVFETFFTDQLDSDAAPKVSKFKISLDEKLTEQVYKIKFLTLNVVQILDLGLKKNYNIDTAFKMQ